MAYPAAATTHALLLLPTQTAGLPGVDTTAEGAATQWKDATPETSAETTRRIRRAMFGCR